MREIVFIKQNKAKWQEIEAVVKGKIKKNPDDLSAIYINLMNDLAYSQTYYPKSKCTLYLNYLSSQIFQKIYKTKRIEQNRISHFFLTEVPLLLYQYRKSIYFAFVFFLIFVIIGVFSSIQDKEFSRLILGDDYVNMTIENIQKGNPVSVYKSGSNWGSSIGIIFNNIIVGAKMYIFGIFGGLGSLYVLLQNSIMLGAFQTFFYEHSVFLKSVRGIWLHGTFEIFSMIIEAAAGLILGASVLFPKSYSRIESFKIGFRDSFKIFLSTVPFTIIAGVIEGYITRYALEMPFFLNVFIIIASLVIISYYYLVFPIKVYIKNKKYVANL